MNKGNHLKAQLLLNPVEFDGIGEYPDLDPKGFQKPLGSVVVRAKVEEVGYGF